MGLFGKKKLDQERIDSNKEKMREVFNQKVEDGDAYKVLYVSSEEVHLNNYVLLRVTKTTISNFILGYKENDPTIILIQTNPELTEFAEPLIFRREEIEKAYKVPLYGSLCIFIDKKNYIQFNLAENYTSKELEEYYVYLLQTEEVKEFRDFFLKVYKK